MSHYFIADDQLAEKKERFNYNFKGIRFEFESNSGLFSMGHVDYASDILINEIPSLKGSLLDLGCGYGPIGIVLGRTYGLDVTFADVNSKAIQYTQANLELNHFSGKVIESNCFDAIEDTFDSIVLNPPIHAGKQIIFQMYKGAFEHLKNNGCFYIVIQKKHGADSSIKALNEIFGNCDVLYKKKGFFVLQCNKRD